MITGSLDDLTTTAAASRSFLILTRIFRELRALPPLPEEGITEWEGKDLLMNVHAYETKPAEDCLWESHRHTADVQMGLGGGECIEWCLQPPSSAVGHYDGAKDFQIWSPDVAPTGKLKLAPRDFVIFLPGEVHRPMIHDGENPRVRKLVVKINERFLGAL
jgi:YhcH/YjgK/YiaL family protein